MKNLFLILLALCSSNLFADIKISGTLSDVTTGPSPSQGTINITCKGRGECGTIKKMSNETGFAEFINKESIISFEFENFEIKKQQEEETGIMFYLNK